MTTNEQWLQAIEIIREVGELDGDDRASEIEARCEGHTGLREVVETLLKEHDEDSVGIWDSIDEQLGLGFVGDDPKLFPTIDGVELHDVLGRGGSGDVFAGRQSSPAREVAVKVLRTGLGSRRALQRFDREARALAAIDHEAVASIYSVGEARLPGGALAPCLLMELVTGRTLRDIKKPMPVDAAARLVSKIARGLHAAHQRGVVHRDLKPSNVLLDAEGRPKIIDFGVATLNADHAQLTVQTMTGELLGTLGYMSPEQLDGSGDVIDVRTDVYALGVLFYELVAGTPAVDAGSGSSFATIQAVVQGSLPKLPTGGDADAIYRKATAHEARQRYDSAASFADDLDRMVEGRPITARPPSSIYAAQLFVRRNPVPVALGALAVAAVVGLSIATTIGFVAASDQRDAALLAEAEASRERDAAQQSERRAIEASTFLRDMLASPDPDVDGPSVRVVDVLDRSSELIEDRYSDEPLVAMDLHRTLGWTYAAISQHPEAVMHFERAIELGQTVLDSSSNDLLQLETNYADALIYVGEAPRAVEIMQGVVERCEAAEGLDRDTLPAAKIGLGEAFRQAGDTETATQVFTEALELSETTLGEEHPQTQAALSGLGRCYLDVSMPSDAQLQFRRLLGIFESLGNTDTPSWYIAHGNLGIALAGSGEHDAAIECYERVLDEGGDLLGEDHYTLRMVRNIIGDSYLAVGRVDDALRMGRLAIDDSTRINGPAHEDTFLAMSNHAVTLMELDRHDEALPLTSAVVDGLTEVIGPDHPRTMIGLRNHAGALDGVGRTSESAEIFYDLIDRQTRVLGDDSFDTILTKNNLAFQLCGMERFEEAVDLMREVLSHTGEDSVYPPFVRAAFKRNLGRALLGTGDLVNAEAALRNSLAIDPDNPTTIEKSGELLEQVLNATENAT